MGPNEFLSKQSMLRKFLRGNCMNTYLLYVETARISSLITHQISSTDFVVCGIRTTGNSSPDSNDVTCPYCISNSKFIYVGGHLM